MEGTITPHEPERQTTAERTRFDEVDEVGPVAVGSGKGFDASVYEDRKRLGGSGGSGMREV